MAILVSFRVVGIYCYIPFFPVNAAPETTVKSVMDAIVDANLGFGYQPNNGDSVQTLSYDYREASTRPFNTVALPTSGPRSLTENISDDPALVWQYYRSVSGVIDGARCEIKLVSGGQPSFATQPLNANDVDFGTLPSKFEIINYNLTWRLVQLQLSPEKKALLMRRRSSESR
jgi:hypothetical protein